MRTARRGEVEIRVDAPPDAVWAMLADLERMGEWSPECYRVRWLDGARSPATPGARFEGWNRFGRLRWSVTCVVKTAEPGREIAFSTLQRSREVVLWRYRLDPADGGTRLTESFEVLWMPLQARITEDWLMRDRDRRREEAMRVTLERIKAAAERRKASAADSDT